MKEVYNLRLKPEERVLKILLSSGKPSNWENPYPQIDKNFVAVGHIEM